MEGQQNFADKFLRWVKLNWFTVVGIIIVLMLVGYDYGTLKHQIKSEVDNCNDFWTKKVEASCPIAGYGNQIYQSSYNNNVTLVILNKTEE